MKDNTWEDFILFLLGLLFIFAFVKIVTVFG